MATQDEPANDPLVSQETEVFKAELLATVGHELRGPLTAIKGFAATLLRHERRISHEERHEFLVAISAASDRLELIIERFLEISQLETDAIRIERFPVDVARLAHEALTVAEQRASEHTPARFTFHLRLKDAFGTHPGCANRHGRSSPSEGGFGPSVRERYELLPSRRSHRYYCASCCLPFACG